MKMLPFSQHGDVPGLHGGVHYPLDVFFVCLLQIPQERSNGSPVGDAQCYLVLVVSAHQVVQCAVTRVTKSAIQQISQRGPVSHSVNHSIDVSISSKRAWCYKPVIENLVVDHSAKPLVTSQVENNGLCDKTLGQTGKTKFTSIHVAVTSSIEIE